MCPSIVTGDGNAAQFIEATEAALTAELGFRPFPGTLNVDRLSILDELPKETARADELVTDHCDGVDLWPCSVGGIRSAVLRPLVADYPEDKLELVAPVHLRSLFALDDGDEIVVSPPEDVWHPSGELSRGDALGEFDAVVFDLDGTLVDLDVDWEGVHTDIAAVLEGVIDGPLAAYSRPEVLQLARENGYEDELHQLLTEYERDGALSASKRTLLGTLSDLECPVGICTANATAAARRALERYDSLDAVDAIVGRETGTKGKPHPRPLQSCLDRLGAAAGNAVFIGDERTDAETAVATGSSFLHPDQFD